MHRDDLDVDLLSSCLEGWTLDVIVSGSVGALESARFIRALRRLGAEVRPILTEGGSRFVTPLSLAWAANHPVTEVFLGTASHTSVADAVVVAPASANLISDLAHGRTSTPATALLSSALGRKKPVLIVPNMHESMSQSPFVRQNLEKITKFVKLMSPRMEESKLKFPDPAVLADEVSHFLLGNGRKVLLTMGSTQAKIDEVRHISNYSSGMLGKLSAEELYRWGFETHVLKGACEYRPSSASRLLQTTSHSEMLQEFRYVAKAEKLSAALFLASVADYVPERVKAGKVRSDMDAWDLKLVRAGKIIDADTSIPIRIGMKLEVETLPSNWHEIARKYLLDKGLSLLLVNSMKDVSSSIHKATVYEASPKTGEVERGVILNSKKEIAQFFASYLRGKMGIEAAQQGEVSSTEN